MECLEKWLNNFWFFFPEKCFKKNDIHHENYSQRSSNTGADEIRECYAQEIAAGLAILSKTVRYP